MREPGASGAAMDFTQGPAVLFVDDDEANLKVLSVHLGGEFQILTAQNGPDALEMLERLGPEIGVVVTDQRMAGMTGVELLSVVCEHYPDVGRMLITAYADFDPLIAAINEGQISGFVRKPWSPGEIRVLLRAGLERVVLRRSLRQVQLELLHAEQTNILAFVLSGVGYQVSNPAAAIRLNLEFLGDHVATLRGLVRSRDLPDPEALESTLADMASTLGDCSHAARTLFDVAGDLRALLANPEGTPLVPTDTNDCALRALRFLRPHLTHRARVETTLGPVFSVLADPARLTHVVVNLLANAAIALDGVQDGRVKRIGLVTRPEGDGAVLEVSDNGVGIPRDALAHMFDPFRVDRTGRTRQTVGLSMCRQLVEQWGGTITADSSADDGNLIRIVLPPPASWRDVAVRGGSCGPGQGDKPPPNAVLVVDDDVTVLRAVERCLGKHYRVDAVASGARAMELLCERSYVAVICDVQMPRPDGEELYAFVKRERPELAGSFAFMNSGAMSDELVRFMEQARGDGAQILHKPFSNDDLRKAVANLIGPSA